MGRYWLRIIQIMIVTAGVLSCTGSNLYKDLASNKTSDEALYEDATKLIDDGDYTAAITKLLATSSSFQASSKLKESLAGAYAARCGMEFIPYVTNLSGGSSSSLYSMAMNGFVGVDTSNYADCQRAETLIESIGSIGNRTQSQNLFLMVLELAKMGNRIRASVDVLPTAVGDGTVDAGFSCRTTVSITAAKEIMESFYKFVAQAGAVGNGILGAALGDSIEDIEGDLPDLDYSDGTDPAGPDEGDIAINFSRTLLNTSTFGVGACNDSDLTNCFCPP